MTDLEESGLDTMAAQSAAPTVVLLSLSSAKPCPSLHEVYCFHGLWIGTFHQSCNAFAGVKNLRINLEN
jgi:hypothetical protein